MAVLIIGEGGGDERRVELGPGVTTVGREPESDVRFGEGEELVSPCHASLQEDSSRWYVRDEGSRFGTYVNDRRVKEQGLVDGDLIELGLGGPRVRFVERGGEDGGAEPQAGGGAATQVRTAFRKPGADS